MLGTDGPSILADEPLASLLTAGPEGEPASVAGRAARALLDLPEVSPVAPPWLAPHQHPAAVRLTALLERYGGAVLADAPGMGKSYVALAVALMRREPFTLVVPAVLVGQWRALCGRFAIQTPIITHESLSRPAVGPFIGQSPSRDFTSRREQHRDPLLVVDEAHHFRNPATKRFRALAAMAIGARVVLVTATPVHNRIADIVHLLRLFLRDDGLAGLGVPSLKRAAAGESWAALPAALAHLVVARSRARAPSLSLPRRARGKVTRVAPTSDEQLAALVREIEGFSPGPAGALMRMVLLYRLASSLTAFRESLSRHEAFADVAAEARAAGRALTRRDFQRLFPRGDEPDLQLALIPMLLPPGADGDATDLTTLRRLRDLASVSADPKLARLDQLLRERPAKTIVFTSSRATARHLLRSLKSRHRAAVVMGARGLLPAGPASVPEVLRLFAPVATGAPHPPAALSIDVLIATDLASEGLNLQDASRVVHYDLPWTPARLAQRLGRIDRLGSTHSRIETVSFLPAPSLARAIQIEARLAAKERAGRRATFFDWCDRLQALSVETGEGAACAVRGTDDAVLLVVAVGGIAEPILVGRGGVTSDPRAACSLLEEAATAPPLPLRRADLSVATCRAGPAIRKRLNALATSRWRAGDRDQLSRRLIPMVVAAARAAAREGDARRVAQLDALVERLGSGMTAGEELSLGDLAQGPLPLTIEALLQWSRRLPISSFRTPDSRPLAPELRLVAAVVVRAREPG